MLSLVTAVTTSGPVTTQATTTLSSGGTTTRSSVISTGSPAVSTGPPAVTTGSPIVSTGSPAVTTESVGTTIPVEGVHYSSKFFYSLHRKFILSLENFYSFPLSCFFCDFVDYYVFLIVWQFMASINL